MYVFSIGTIWLNEDTSFGMRLIILLLFSVAAVWGGASGETEEMKKLAFASNDFGLKLFSKIEPGENVFISPTSVFTALSMLYQGARGETAQEIRQTLFYLFLASDDVDGLNEENIKQNIRALNEEDIKQNIRALLNSIIPSLEQYRLDIFNAMFSQVGYPVRDEYKEILETYFDAVMKEVDFANNAERVLAEINERVKNETRGKIPKLLGSLDPSTVLVLLNAVYFKSAWEVEFSRKKTRDATFYNNGVDPVIVPMMNGREKVLYWENEASSAVKLPYKGNNVSMVLLLPNERDGLSTLEQQLDIAKFEEIVSNMFPVFVATDIPRFKLEYSKELNSLLQSLGMSRVFTNGANLSGISDVGGLKVSRIVHKAYVEVNEGSEAAGASGIEIIPESDPGPSPYVFKADHPFLFVIRHEITKMSLLFGRVNAL